MQHRIKIIIHIVAIKLSHMEKHITKLTTSIILRYMGENAAISYFIHSPFTRRTPETIVSVHEEIHDKAGPSAADHLAVSLLSTNPRPKYYDATLVATGERRPSVAILQEQISHLTAAARSVSGASIALVSSLAFRGNLDLAMKVIAERQRTARAAESLDWAAVRDALTPHRLSDAKTATQAFDPLQAATLPPARNRLIISDEELPPSAIRDLATGAGRIALLQYRDLYGRVDLSSMQAEMPHCEITIEHARSRVHRFHRRYFSLHQKTLHAAERLSKNFVEYSPWLKDFIGDLQSFERDLTLELSDKFFFKALRLEGVRSAALDPSFDSVVVLFGNNSELYKLFSADSKLWRDPRIVGCCRSRDPHALVEYAKRITELRQGASNDHTASTRESAASSRNGGQMAVQPQPPRIVRSYLLSADRVAAPKANRAASRANVAFVTHEGRAYGATAIQLATHLHIHFNVDVILTAGNTDRLRDDLISAQDDPYLPSKGKRRQPGYVKLAPPHLNAATKRAFSDFFLLATYDTAKAVLSETQEDRVANCAIDFLLSNELPRTVLHSIANARAISALFDKRQYSVVAISPIRTPRNSQFASIARGTGIPSLAVEPHLLNAAYCRYGTISTDYVALYSEYFAEEYEQHFGIPRERCYLVGSPRILQPVNYSSVAEKKDARASMGFLEDFPPIIAFPTQPMPSKYSLAIWRMVIRAVKGLDIPVHVILKPHPEEGLGHVAKYEHIASEEDATSLCVVRNVNIKDLLIASDLVLSCYSTTAIEAMVLERRVAVVGLGGVDYPMRWHEILDIPRCDDSEQLKRVILDALLADNPMRPSTFKKLNPVLFTDATFDRLAQAVDEIVREGPSGIRDRDELPASLFVTAPFREYLI